MEKKIIPEEFQIPLSFECDEFVLEVLTPEIVEIDYEAVMSSRSRLRTVFGRATQWPREGMTLEEDKVDLINHQNDFLAREAFAYTVLSKDRKKCLGCIYITPTLVELFDSEVYLWVRDDCIELDKKLFTAVNKWLYDSWPIEQAAFPGRTITWDEWEPIAKLNKYIPT